MDGREQDCHERAAGKRGVYCAQAETEQPAGMVRGDEDRRVDEREAEAVREMHEVADDARRPATLDEEAEERYVAEFNRAVARRLPRFALGLEDS